MTRLAIISDTHMPRGGRRIPDACVQRMREADLILHAGDLITTDVLDALRRLGPPVHAIHGNVDGPSVRALLPATLTLTAGGARIGMIHDAGPANGRLNRMRRAFPRCDAVVFGHSHIPLHETDGAFHIFNPGSPTERRRSPTHTMGLATVDDGAISFEIVHLD